MNAAIAPDLIDISLPGKLSSGGGSALACTIEQIGLEEAAVTLDTSNALEPGQLVTLEFALPGHGEGGVVAGLITRIDGSRASLSFEIPDQHAVRALNDWAFAVRHGAREDTRGFDPRRARELFEACRHLTRRFFADHLPLIPEQARNILFERAQNASSNSQQADSFDAMHEVDRLMTAIRKAFLESFEGRMDRLWSGEPEGAESVAMPEELSLVDTGSFNDWLLTVQIVTRARRHAQDRELVLAAKLSDLLTRPLEPRDLPFGHESVCSSFHDALQNLGASRSTRQALLIALESRLVAGLGRLHEELIEDLESSGVAAPPPAIPIRHAKTPRSSGSSVSASTVKLDDSAPIGSPPEARRTIGPSRARPAQSAPGTAHALMHLASGGAVASGGNAEARSPATQALLGSLASLEPTFVDANRPLGFAKAVKDLLERSHVSIEGQDEEVLELVSDLLDAMSSDRLVHPAIKTELRRLAAPLTYLAVTGEVFFAQESNPIRAVIDTLAEIRPDAEELARIRSVTDRIVEADPPTPQAFARALRVLAPIAVQQRRQREGRIHALQRTWERQQAAKNELRAGEREEAARTLPTELRAWSDRAEQLEVGDAALFDADRSLAWPATLAWRSADGQTLIFVGDEQESLPRTLRELAMDLHRGRVQEVDGASFSLTERAVYRRLYSLHKEVQDTATQDALTGLVNRKRFEGELGAALGRASQSFDPVHLCLVEIDGFSSIVGRCGPKVAKQLVKRLGGILERQLGTHGLACRLEANRFGVLLHLGDREASVSQMQRFKRSVAEARCVFQGKPFPITVSLGLIALQGEIEDASAAMEMAVKTLEAALAAGGNCLHIARGTSPESLSDAAANAREPTVRSLIASGQLGLRAQRVQPINGDPSALPYYEVLLGVKQADGSLGGPGRVIGGAERRGDILTLDRWVIREALSWMASRPALLERVAGFAINLSGVSLSDATLLDYVLQELRTRPVPPSKIIFEVTETAGISSFSTAQAFVRTLRERGCEFSLDDFGAGHASFAYLKSLPVSKIKIDGMFVRDLVANPDDWAVVRSINEIAHFMGRHTVAEFVEDAKTLSALVDLGVDYAQGFYLEKPRPIDDIDPLESVPAAA